MSRVKKISIIIALIIINTLGIINISNAVYSKGQRVRLGMSDWLYNPNILCLEYGQDLGYGRYYTTVANVHIEGNKATDSTGKSIDSWHNAKLAYILSKDASGSKVGSDVQNASWAYMATWIRNVGTNFDGIKPQLAYNSSTGGGRTWLNQANAYANTLKEETIKSKIDYKNVKVETYKNEDKTELKIGPFNYEFTGVMSKVELSDDHEKTITPTGYGKYVGNEFKTANLNEIKSGENFYMIIPANSGIGIIDHINIVAERNVKSADVAFLRCDEASWQNLVQYSHSEKNMPTEGKWDDVNIRLLIELSGFVWEDRLGGKDNSYAVYGENTYVEGNNEEGDRLLEGITVRLKDKDGNIVKNSDGQEAVTKTDSKGAYKFKNILIANLEDYMLEFEYNGLAYTSVKPLVGDKQEVNSKAGEVIDERKALNSAFTEITNKGDINDRNHGYSRDGAGKETGTITYKNDIANWQSTFESTTYNKDITANTKVTNYSLSDQFKKENFKTNDDGSLEIQYLNLGLVRREQPQMSISNDIESAQVDVNGYSHTYYYAQRNSRVQDTTAFNVGVKFGKEYVSGYRRAIYPSDVKFSAEEAKDDDARKLKVYVTYATTIRNMSNKLQMSVNELVNYYDKNYTIVDSWVGDNNSNKVSWTNTSKYGQSYNDGNYIGAYTTSLAGTKIKAGENLKVYVRFQVSDSAVLGLLSGTATLHNASEIFSYSTYYGSDIEGCKTGDIYAGIDRVSAPGNAKPGDKTTYEADTDDAPSLILEAKGVRELAGTVFEDATEKDLQTGKERLGSGKYEENENIISGVKVDLLKVSDGATATVYPPEGADEDTATKGTPATTFSGTDGKYIFRGVEPDTYLIRYTYANGETKLLKPNKDAQGNITYEEITDRKITVQDYKSTIITSNEIKQAFEDNDKHLNWYKETETKGRYSDARDDYTAREAIDNKLMSLEGTSTPTITSLTADTPKFDIGVEKESVYTASTGDRYTALTENIDFGLVERPRQSATLGKEVSYLKVTLPNGQVLIDGDPRTGNLEYITVTRDAKGKVQEIYITIDSELIYGSQVEIKYDFTLANTSELDYRNKSYYYYGDSKENPVKFTSATLIDYVDSDITLKAGQEGTWRVLDLATEGYNTELMKLIKSDKEEDKKELNKLLREKYSTLVVAEKALVDESGKAIELSPVEAGKEPVEGVSKATTAIYVEKLLANSDELIYENNGEVVHIGKTGGRTMTTILGSYAPRLAADVNAGPELGETDEAKAESVTIIPPTGSTDNTVMYAIIGTAGLIVLAVGVYGTKRFLKK